MHLGGITNIIGFVKGTKLPEEFILFDTHYDGQNNINYKIQSKSQEMTQDQ